MVNLFKIKDSELFHMPVDIVLLGIPDYFDIIKKPMDFSTVKVIYLFFHIFFIQRKLNNMQYTNFKEFTEDIELVFNNCHLYNGVN